MPQYDIKCRGGGAKAGVGSAFWPPSPLRLGTRSMGVPRCRLLRDKALDKSEVLGSSPTCYPAFLLVCFCFCFFFFFFFLCSSSALLLLFISSSLLFSVLFCDLVCSSAICIVSAFASFAAKNPKKCLQKLSAVWSWYMCLLPNTHPCRKNQEMHFNRPAHCGAVPIVSGFFGENESGNPVFGPLRVDSPPVLSAQSFSGILRRRTTVRLVAGPAAVLLHEEVPRVRAWWGYTTLFFPFSLQPDPRTGRKQALAGRCAWKRPGDCSAERVY